MPRRRRGATAALGLAVALLVAGCSYTPARIDTGPLVEIGGHHSDHRHRERHEPRHEHRGHRHHRRDRDRHHRRHRDHRGFCPPGQAKHGRC
ncbi:hypothetical protein [Halomonas borealis]|uniref:hypothetical protein n=1 Tax=Halomonas borealis TaxID=2508710 RepID=UPI0010A03910|nr:hypothetical protein [Halomonas borealis]